MEEVEAEVGMRELKKKKKSGLSKPEGAGQ